jgi:hypothetical protein
MITWVRMQKNIWNMSIGSAYIYSKKINRRSLSAPNFLRCLILNDKCETFIQVMHGQKLCGKSLIFLFTKSIWKTHTSCGKLPLNFIALIKIYKFMWFVLSTVIRSKNFYWLVSFTLKKCFAPLKGFKSFRFLFLL